MSSQSHIVLTQPLITQMWRGTTREAEEMGTRKQIRTEPACTDIDFVCKLQPHIHTCAIAISRCGKAYLITAAGDDDMGWIRLKRCLCIILFVYIAVGKR